MKSNFDFPTGSSPKASRRADWVLDSAPDGSAEQLLIHFDRVILFDQTIANLQLLDIFGQANKSQLIPGLQLCIAYGLNLMGAVNVLNSTFSGNGGSSRLSHSTGSATINLAGSMFTGSTGASQSGFFLSTSGDASIALNVTDSEFSSNARDGLQVSANGESQITLLASGSP